MSKQKKTLEQIIDDIADGLYDYPSDDVYPEHIREKGFKCNCRECFIANTVKDIRESIYQEIIDNLQRNKPH